MGSSGSWATRAKEHVWKGKRAETEDSSCEEGREDSPVGVVTLAVAVIGGPDDDGVIVHAA